MLMQFQAPATLLVVATVISGCSSTGGSYAVPEGHYQTYDCNLLKGTIAGHQHEVKELQQLMARAESATGGAIISAFAYRTSYDQAVARVKEARTEAARKGCVIQGPSGSDRSLY